MTRTILLADDSVTIQKVIELTFMDDDYRVVAASNGDEALAKLPATRPDIVIADVHMPGTNGYGLARAVKDLWPNVPVLLLVGTFEPFDEGEARASGADGHMKKPFDSQELQRRVEELIGSGPATATLDETLPPPPDAALGFLEEDTSRRIGFDFDLESEPAAPLVTEIDDGGARMVYTPDLERGFAPDLERGFAPGSDLGFDPTAPPELEPELAYEPEPVASAPEPVAEPVREPAPVAESPGAFLSADDVDRIARRVVELLGDKPVRDVAWEVVPDLAEVVIRERLRELESQVD